MLEMAINNVEVGTEKDRVDSVSFCDILTSEGCDLT